MKNELIADHVWPWHIIKHIPDVKASGKEGSA